MSGNRFVRGQKALSLFGAVLCAAVCSSCRPPEAANGQRLVLTGSSTIAPLAGELAKEFEKRHPGVRVDVQMGGSSRGVADVRRGLNDIGMVSRDLRPGEKDLNAYAVALDGVCMIVHKQNPVRELTRDQIIAIYTGRIRNWKDVGGTDAAITVVNKSAAHSTLQLFLEHFKLKNGEIRADIIIGNNEEAVKSVVGNPHALAYVSIGTAEYDAALGTPIKLLPLAGVPASTETVRSRRFPLIRTLHLVTREAPRGLAKEFLDFARSKDAHQIIRGQSFVPLQE